MGNAGFGAKRPCSVDDRGGFDLDQMVRYVESRDAQQRCRMGTGVTPSFAAAREMPSRSRGILSGVQSTTWTVSFATSAKEPPTSASAVPMLR